MQPPPVKPYIDLPQLGELAEGMVRDSLNAVVSKDIESARSVLHRGDNVDRQRDQIFRALLAYMMESSSLVFPAFELILVAKNLERVGDHATNIAEDVIYMAWAATSAIPRSTTASSFQKVLRRISPPQQIHQEPSVGTFASRMHRGTARCKKGG